MFDCKPSGRDLVYDYCSKDKDIVDRAKTESSTG